MGRLKAQGHFKFQPGAYKSGWHTCFPGSHTHQFGVPSHLLPVKGEEGERIFFLLPVYPLNPKPAGSERQTDNPIENQTGC